jgi:hypothetical protein
MVQAVKLTLGYVDGAWGAIGQHMLATYRAPIKVFYMHYPFKPNRESQCNGEVSSLLFPVYS